MMPAVKLLMYSRGYPRARAVSTLTALRLAPRRSQARLRDPGLAGSLRVPVGVAGVLEAGRRVDGRHGRLPLLDQVVLGCVVERIADLAFVLAAGLGRIGDEPVDGLGKRD